MPVNSRFFRQVFIWLTGFSILPTNAWCNDHQAHISDRYLANYFFLDVVSTSHHLIAVGERGVIALSDTAGKTWQTIPSPVDVLLTAVHFVDDNNGWISGHDGTLLNTQDGGEHWQRVKGDKNSDPLFDVYFWTVNKGIAIGAYGSYFQTSDGGKNWQQKYISEDDRHLYAITGSDTFLIIVGENGTIFRSIDAGEHWQNVESPYRGTLFGITKVADKTLLTFGLRGNILYSENAGQLWHLLPSHRSNALNTCVNLHGIKVICAGTAGDLLTGDVDTYQFQTVKLSARNSISKLLPLADSHILAVGNSGILKIQLAPF